MVNCSLVNMVNCSLVNMVNFPLVNMVKCPLVNMVNCPLVNMVNCLSGFTYCRSCAICLPCITKVVIMKVTNVTSNCFRITLCRDTHMYMYNSSWLVLDSSLMFGTFYKKNNKECNGGTNDFLFQTHQTFILHCPSTNYHVY